MARPTPSETDAAIETLGNLVAMAGGEGDEALDVVKDAVCLPELMGAKQAAETLGTTAGNLKRWAALPEPLYGPDHPDPWRRVATGNLYDADQIRELARERKAASRAGGKR